MQSSAKAGLEFHGALMRYSEIERYGAQYRLLRLGDCDFEFDVSEVLFSGGDDKYLGTIADALTEIFLGTSATQCCVVVHPPTSRTFQSMASDVPTADQAGKQIGFESALLYDEAVNADSRHIIHGAQSDSDEELGLESIFISEVPIAIRKRLDRITSGFGDLEIEVISSSVAVARLSARLAAARDDMPGLALAIGQHADATEYVVTRSGAFLYYQSRDETEAGDVLYFALQALKQAQINPLELSRVQYYGTRVSDADLAMLASVFGERLVSLNPMPVVDLASDRFDEDFKFESFALCLGAAL